MKMQIVVFGLLVMTAVGLVWSVLMEAVHVPPPTRLYDVGTVETEPQRQVRPSTDIASTALGKVEMVVRL
jgi:hypothetical protein